MDDTSEDHHSLWLNTCSVKADENQSCHTLTASIVSVYLQQNRRIIKWTAVKEVNAASQNSEMNCAIDKCFQDENDHQNI